MTAPTSRPEGAAALLAHDLEGSGPLLLAVHGITESRLAWDGVPLAQRFRTLRVDLRGHGASPQAGPYDPMTMAQDLADLLEHLGETDPPLVVGHSYGAVVATAFASRFPVRGVVAVDQPLDVAPLPAAVAEAVTGAGFDAFMASFFPQFHGALSEDDASRLAAARVIRKEVVLGAWEPLLTLDAQHLQAWSARLMTLPAGTPYLSLHGLPVGTSYASWLDARIPGAVVEAAPVVTHWPHVSRPAWFVDRLERFDASLPRG